jgi:hypothetical protein
MGRMFCLSASIVEIFSELGGDGRGTHLMSSGNPDHGQPKGIAGQGVSINSQDHKKKGQVFAACLAPRSQV